ncbi:hypothetical protein C0Q70_01820 [Pomacea canaliculata]|uniref:Chitobiosyldiphosphodolichol beta-mannosyltransferase n=1 Tax=Pomacea canaliculata TaxID=400727 RepID=A0A2T7Q0J3_POMCA|nr:chitobiosyldiphosphodolichol beta-mannosyltransferase-like [Pomacea canaliculata]XP_025082185.1 chitobiosyldiphosphodolichol beta-mannosyltransferase-like [Pomacea canaliculata]PVD39192.1 hypothetical protein C0Q70_01820 [Pomacea canaliculata]
MLQNPPTIPTFVVAWFVSVVRSSQLVIDWHNYGYTILALKLGFRHPLVSISKWVEKIFGRFAVANICVTNAMRQDLIRNWQISATTVYDRPPDIFKPTSLQEQHELFVRLSLVYPVFQARPPSQNTTRFTCCSSEGTVMKLATRPVLLVSSTSWTEDEDFKILLDALQDYEEKATDDTPQILCVITGKGPQKEMYMEKIASQTWKKVEFCLPWLTAEDYPLLLGSADIGVCLHNSSSGLDLPMKVVDMFGCGLPVCAVRFNCIEELVKDDENGLLFDNSNQLADHLQDLLRGFPEKLDKLERYRGNLKAFQEHRWEEQWQVKVLPLFQEERTN